MCLMKLDNHFDKTLEGNPLKNISLQSHFINLDFSLNLFTPIFQRCIFIKSSHVLTEVFLMEKARHICKDIFFANNKEECI